MSETPLTARDMQLLEDAAEAAGIDHISKHTDGFVYAHNQACSERVRWNPLHDDGDALRLASNLNICIEFGCCSDDAPVVRVGLDYERETWQQHPHFPDHAKATRYAIVCAAAALLERTEPT